ncbi:hypothetical protein F4811DRAFT_535687 [Daldinia bambusicola]|nr:hypothetical protein F4811DRAFT_535687 [Daldinia bambusicola]
MRSHLEERIIYKPYLSSVKCLLEKKKIQQYHFSYRLYILVITGLGNTNNSLLSPHLTTSTTTTTATKLVAMSQGGEENWWYKNHMDEKKFPNLPIKRELIYRIFRAAYPGGAFVDDDLKLVKLRDKDDVWCKLMREFDQARKDLDFFISRLRDTYRVSSDDRATLKHYYTMLLNEAEGSLFRSQNGRYFEFRCIEELLVRYRTMDPDEWALLTFAPDYPLPPIAGYKYAAGALDNGRGSELYHFSLNYMASDGNVQFITS